MRYLSYLLIACGIALLLYLLDWALLDRKHAIGTAIVTFPLSLWTARIIVALRRGRITRRIPCLGGGELFSGHFWSFTPEVYVRKPGFDNFRGYTFRESLACLLGWILLLAGPLTEFLHRNGIDVR